MRPAPWAGCGARPRIAHILAFDDVDEDYVVDVQRLRRDMLGDRQRHDAAVAQPRADVAPAAVAEDHRDRPMHVVERQPRALQRDLPDRLHDAAAAQRVGALLGGDAGGDLAEAELGAVILGAIAVGLVAGQAVLQCGLRRRAAAWN